MQGIKIARESGRSALVRRSGALVVGSGRSNADADVSRRKESVMPRISPRDQEKFPIVLSEVPWVHLHHKVLFLRTFLHFCLGSERPRHKRDPPATLIPCAFSFQVFNMGAVNEFMDIIGLGSVGIGLCKGGVEVYKVAGRMPGGAPVSFRGIATGGSPIQMGALGAYSLFVRCLEVSKKVASAPLLTNSPRSFTAHRLWWSIGSSGRGAGITKRMANSYGPACLLRIFADIVQGSDGMPLGN